MGFQPTALSALRLMELDQWNSQRLAQTAVAHSAVLIDVSLSKLVGSFAGGLF